MVMSEASSLLSGSSLPENTPDLYQTLGFSTRHSRQAIESADIRAAYKRSLLANHPDKKSDRALGTQGLTIDTISLAYKVLSDPVLRAEYDQALLTAQAQHKLPDKFTIFHTGLESIDLDDLAYNEHDNTWTKYCRCGVGGGYVVKEDELEAHAEDGELITGCRGCSLWIRVMFSAA